ncbi:nuclease [Acinetobacter bereziniae]|uniref:nuclease n=1 Tax=Acinetobacter bereziniae TaxID=106648 RepID=UPI00124FC5D4|nr:nuclease [Acinetobacter bereziniae]
MSGRHTTGSGSTSPNKTKPSVTKPSTKGTEIKLETGTNKTYLCAHICAASKAPKIGAIGQKLYQQTVTNAIKAEADLNFGVWAYLAEVGYDMTGEFPEPLMSEDPARMHRPSTFPLGAAKKQIENLSKGDFRIPDVTVLAIKAAEIIEMRMSGTIDWKRFKPKQKNIERLVEIKFGKDDWAKGQLEAYKLIAPDRVREVSDKDCSCSTRKPPSGGTKIPVYPPIKNPTPYQNATFRPANTGLTAKKGIPSMLGALGKLIAPPSPEVQFYRKLVPLQEYKSLMIPITASVGIGGVFICGTVVLAGAAGTAVATAGAIGATEAVGGGVLITGFATLAHS